MTWMVSLDEEAYSFRHGGSMTVHETIGDPAAEAAFDEVLDRLCGEPEPLGYVAPDDLLPPLDDPRDRTESVEAMALRAVESIQELGGYTEAGKAQVEEWLRSLGVDPSGLPRPHDGRPAWLFNGRQLEDFCQKGHPLEEDNIQETSRGRTCRTCYLAWKRDYERERRAMGLVRSRAKGVRHLPCWECGTSVARKRVDNRPVFCDQNCKKRYARRRAA